MGCAVTHCTSSWVLPQLPILFLQLIPYRALHPETREALTKWGIIRRPLMQVRNTFRSLRAVSFKVVFVWVFFFLFFSRKSNMRGDEQTDAEEMFAGIRRAALDSPDGDQAAGRESWRAGNRFTSVHDRLWHVQMSVRSSLWTPQPNAHNVPHNGHVSASVCLHWHMIKGCAQQYVNRFLCLWCIHKGLYKSTGCDG